MYNIIYGDTEQWEVDAQGILVRRLSDASYKKAIMLSEIIPITEELDSDTAYNYKLVKILKSDSDASIFKLLLLRINKVIKRKKKSS